MIARLQTVLLQADVPLSIALVVGRDDDAMVRITFVPVRMRIRFIH
jgi:hypothetical protein